MKRRKSLHRQFISTLFLTAGLLAVLAALIGYEVSHRRSLAEGRETLEGITSTMSKTASVGVYAADRVLLQELVDGIASHPLVSSAEVRDAQGQSLARGASAGTTVNAPAANGAKVTPATPAAPAAPAASTIEHQLGSPFSAQEVVGTLVLTVNDTALRQNARRDALMPVIAILALTTVLALTLNAMALNYLARPMEQLARQLAGIEPGTDQRLVVEARHEDDELGVVAHAANRLLSASAEALQRERTARDAIAVMEAQYRQIFDFTSAGIFVLDDDGRLVNSNPTVAQLLGTSVENMANLRHANFVGDVFESPASVLDMISRADRRRETIGADLRVRRLDGSLRWVHCLVSVHPGDGAGRQRLIEGVIYDVTQRKIEEDEASHRAEHDPLTGLKNRAGFERVLGDCLATARAKGTEATLLFIDLDGFKAVNDHHGHAAGDYVLIEVADRLRHLVRHDHDVVGRLGGDELVILLDGVAARSPVATTLATRVVQALSMPVILPQHRQARIGASVGIAGYPLHANDAASLLRAADAAMYKVKRTGKNDFQVAEPTPMQRPLELVERPVTEAHT